MTALTGLVVVHNEERHLADCLASLAFADELVVVLDRCTDGSRAIAQAAGARLVEGAWPLEGPRRHAGIDAATGPWILEVDADERVSRELGAEIRATIATSEPAVYLIPYHNYIGTRLVRFGWGAYNGVSATYRLFTKGAKIWGPQRVHPAVTFNAPKKKLDNAMVHYVDDDLTDTFARLNRDTLKAARDLVDRNAVPGGAKTARRMVTRFWKSYVSRKGYREGRYGVALGVYAALYPLLTYLKARELLAAPSDPSI